MVEEAITRAITGTSVNTNKILRLFLPEEFILGIISGALPPPPPGNSHFLNLILGKD